MRRLVAAIVAAFAAIGFLTTMSASAAGAQNVSFFSSGASAHWTPNHSAILLSETTTAGAYAGAQLMHVGSTAPDTAPSFTDLDSINEPSGGSPRLVIAFSDGGTIYGYAPQMSTTSHPGAVQWDSTQPFAYNVGYDAALALHMGSSVVSAYLVTDSGWEGQAYTNSITDVMYGMNTYAG